MTAVVGGHPGPLVADPDPLRPPMTVLPHRLLDEVAAEVVAAHTRLGRRGRDRDCKRNRQQAHCNEILHDHLLHLLMSTRVRRFERDASHELMRTTSRLCAVRRTRFILASVHASVMSKFKMKLGVLRRQRAAPCCILLEGAGWRRGFTVRPDCD